MSQVPASSSRPIANDLAQLAITWKAVPIASALVEVGVPNFLPVECAGVSVAELADKAKVDVELLYRYMRYVSALGIFKELPDKCFAHNESSKLLLPGQYTFYVLLFFGSAKHGMLSAAEFVTQLRDPSKPAMEHAYGMPFWMHVAQTPELEKHFADFMILLSNQAIPGILRDIKLPEAGIVADVGGGYGHVLLELLKANPKLTGIVYDMPTVAERTANGLKDPNPPSDSIYSKFDAGVKERISVVAGSYTDASQLNRIAHVDVFFLKFVLHNNCDAVCRKILAALFQNMKSTAEIIVCDCVYRHIPNEFKRTTFLDLIMSEALNGKERTEEEWTQLLGDNEDYQFAVSFGGYLSPQSDLALITLKKKVTSA